jgi:hypothetical protein
MHDPMHIVYICLIAYSRHGGKKELPVVAERQQ